MTGIGSNDNVFTAGRTLIRFETIGPIDPVNYTYVIAVNNSLTNPGEPYANLSSFSYWNYVIAFGGVGSANTYKFTSVTTLPTVTRFYINPAGGAYAGYLVDSYIKGSDLTAASTTALQPGAGGGIDFTFDRCRVLDKPNPGGTLGTCPPYQFSDTTWYINLFVVDSTGTIVDSMGTNGASDTSFLYSFDTTAVINNGGFEKTITSSSSSTSAEIFGFQLFNAPYATPTPTASP